MDRRPNFIVIHADQFRADCMSFIGKRRGILTPAIDSIAAQGVNFSSCYAQCPVCIPARLSLLTGMSPQSLGIFENTAVPYLPLETTLPTEMGRGGYQTALVGRTMHTYPFSHPYGFEYYLPGDPSTDQKAKDQFFIYLNNNGVNEAGGYYGNGTANNSRLGAPFHLPNHLHHTFWTTNRALNFLDNRDDSRPFMLFVGYYAPHSPLNPPKAYFDMYYSRDDLDAPIISDYDIPPVSNGSLISSYVNLTGETLRAARAGYYGNITFLDHQIGRILDRIVMMPNTYVIFTSDHGELLGDHYCMHKSKPWQGAVHLPYIIAGPGIKGSKNIDIPCSWCDIAPTILGLANIKVPGIMEGKNMAGLLTGADYSSDRIYIHGESIHRNPDRFGGYQTQNKKDNLIYEAGAQYLTDGKWKYIWFESTGTEQLFNLENDYYEKTNLALNPDYKSDILLWRDRLTVELHDRSEGFCDHGKLIPGKKPFSLSPQMQILHDKRLDEGFVLPHERPRTIPNAEHYRNILR